MRSALHKGIISKVKLYREPDKINPIRTDRFLPNASILGLFIGFWKAILHNIYFDEFAEMKVKLTDSSFFSFTKHVILYNYFSRVSPTYLLYLHLLRCTNHHWAAEQAGEGEPRHGHLHHHEPGLRREDGAAREPEGSVQVTVTNRFRTHLGGL